MLIDLAKHAPPAERAFDVCVAGAGAAGIALTMELAAHGLRIALLESGGASFEKRSQGLCAGESAGLPYTGIYNGRCRVFGGTTALWGGQILELDEHVFGERPGINGGEWPFPKSELTDAYRRAVHLEGLDQSLDDAQAIWRALNAPPPLFGDELYSAFSRWCPITNFAKLHAQALRSHPNITVFLHASVYSIARSGDGESFRSIRTRTRGRTDTEFFARQFVLAAGGIETCRLLLQPDFLNGRGPWAGESLVGRHFQDHISCGVATILESPPQFARHFEYLALRGLKYHAKIKLTPQSQARYETLDVSGTIAATNDGVDDLALAYETFRLWQTRQLQTLTPRRMVHFLKNLHKLAWQKFPYSLPAARTPANQRLRLNIHCEQIPRSAGRIMLTSERDELGFLRARVNWRTDPLEFHTIRTFLRIARDSFQLYGLGQIVPDAGVEEDDEALTAAFRESFHHMGGTRMAANPSAGVVDPDLKLHGARNVYICSSSVFPSAGFANPTHTVIALAVRLAGHLADLAGT